VPKLSALSGECGFNGDLRSDILFRNTTDGSVGLWLVNDFQTLASQSVSEAGDNMQIASLGDFNGDGHSDILWRNSTDGSVSIWEMNGSEVLAAQTEWPSASKSPVPTICQLVAAPWAFHQCRDNRLRVAPRHRATGPNSVQDRIGRRLAHELMNAGQDPGPAPVHYASHGATDSIRSP
jgi:FG-GAP-like repeat